MPQLPPEQAKPTVLFEGCGPRIVFCLPGKTFSMTFLGCWSALLSACQTRDLTVMLRQGYVSCGPGITRALCLGVIPNQIDTSQNVPFGGVDYDFIMWIDSDQVFKPDDFFRLLESPHRVTSGCYISEDRKSIVALPKSSDEDMRVKRPHAANWLSPREIYSIDSKADSKYLELNTCGMGWLLMKYGILEQLQAPWFFYSSALGQIDEYHSPLSGEDSWLCDRIRYLKIPIMLDTSVRVGHEKSVILTI